MFRQFAQKVEDMRRLIENQRSASSVISSSVMSSEHSESRCLFLLAVSGGMDSMCLLDLFSKTLPADDYAVAHCNFSLRGEESDGDQALVEARAAELGVRLFVKRFDTDAYARENGISIEMAARDLRYTWFEELCHEHGFDVLAVAHNANDNAETLMLNLLRGTGLNGLHGMDELSLYHSERSLYHSERSFCHSERSLCHSERSEESIALFRPLLEFTRKQIEGYVLTNRLSYRHDSSNFESDYKRNRIRNEVFPVFEKINPSFVRTLNREIGYFAEAGSIVEDWCRSQLPNVLILNTEEGRTVAGQETGVLASLRKCPSPVRPSSDCNLNQEHRYEDGQSTDVVISTAKLLATPHWRYFLYYILEPYGFNSQTVASVEDLLTSDRTVSGKRFESPTHTLLTTQDSLIVVPSVHEEEPGTSDEVMVVRGAGTYNFNGARFQVELIDWTADMPLKQPAGTLILDADSLRFPFVCRRWRQGDWLIPLGMRGKKKVSDLFADLKFNALQKHRAIILVDTSSEALAEHQHVAALLGSRIDDRYKVTSSTNRVVLIRTL